MFTPIRLLPVIALAGLAACAERVQTPLPESGPPPAPEAMSFLGSWDCGVTVMTFAADKYTPSQGSKPMQVASYSVKGAATDVKMTDGTVVSVQQVDDNNINWYSYASGDTFQCKRVAVVKPKK